MEKRKRRWQAEEGSGRGRDEGPKENGGKAAGGEGDIWRWRKGAAYIRCIDLYIYKITSGASTYIYKIIRLKSFSLKR